MRLLTFLLLLACVGAYRWWDGQGGNNGGHVANQNGFVPVQMPDGAPQRVVLVLAPPDCPSDEAQRADSLARHLSAQGIPVRKGSSISFNVVNPTADQRAGVERAVAVFNRGAPAVFVNGMAMANPTPAQVIAEYHRTRQRL